MCEPLPKAIAAGANGEQGGVQGYLRHLPSMRAPSWPPGPEPPAIDLWHRRHKVLHSAGMSSSGGIGIGNTLLVSGESCNSKLTLNVCSSLTPEQSLHSSLARLQN